MDEIFELARNIRDSTLKQNAEAITPNPPDALNPPVLPNEELKPSDDGLLVIPELDDMELIVPTPYQPKPRLEMKRCRSEMKYGSKGFQNVLDQKQASTIKPIKFLAKLILCVLLKTG